MADIIEKGGLRLVSCSNCKMETELGTYQETFDKWVDEKRLGAMDVYAEKIMGQKQKS
jgi:ASC-1-like (ASCH) protein